MKKINYIRTGALLWFLLLLTNCEEDINFHKKAKAKMIITSLIDCTSNTNTLKISESVSLFSDAKPSKIEQPNLQIKVNGHAVNTPTFLKEKNKKVYYNFTSTLKPGDKVEVSSKTAEYGNVYGADLIPKPAKIKSIDTKWFENTKGNNFLKINTTIEDIPKEKNYYRIVIKNKHSWDYTPEVEWEEKQVFIDQEPIFKNITESINLGGEDFNYKIFSDGMFSDKSYTLNVYIRDDKFDRAEDIKNNHKHFIKVEIHSISETMYKYLKSVELALKQDNFQDPIKLHTNIDGGYGVIGAYNKTSIVKEVTK